MQEGTIDTCQMSMVSLPLLPSRRELVSVFKSEDCLRLDHRRQNYQQMDQLANRVAVLVGI